MDTECSKPRRPQSSRTQYVEYGIINPPTRTTGLLDPASVIFNIMCPGAEENEHACCSVSTRNWAPTIIYRSSIEAIEDPDIASGGVGPMHEPTRDAVTRQLGSQQPAI